MLTLPGNLTPQTFLQKHWQKQPLFMPAALDRLRPAVTRNELGWLATLDDVESRLVFVDRSGAKPHYRAETGPFEPEYLQNLPKRDWTLLVHDVEKHLPDLRVLFQNVPFIPDWRIDDLLVSFAAPGGGVGPHRDNYDVFLCQGIGVREWRFTNERIADDPLASSDLALLTEFEDGEAHDMREGDVLYLPPGAAHWGAAKRACMTYSIGMRAPEASDIALAMNQPGPETASIYRDPDLSIDEVKPGHISSQSAVRAATLLGKTDAQFNEVAEALGKFSTQPKDWLRPEGATTEEAKTALRYLADGGALAVHGMAQIAFDDQRLYVNGSSHALVSRYAGLIERTCRLRVFQKAIGGDAELLKLAKWMLEQGAFEIPEIS